MNLVIYIDVDIVYLFMLVGCFVCVMFLSPLTKLFQSQPYVFFVLVHLIWVEDGLWGKGQDLFSRLGIASAGAKWQGLFRI